MDNPSSSSKAHSLDQTKVQQRKNDKQSLTHREPASAAPTSRYIRDFESLFVPIDPGHLRAKAQNGNLRHCQFRSLCWRYFLHCLPENYNDWLPSCKESRIIYNKTREKHSIKINSPDVQVDRSSTGHRSLSITTGLAQAHSSENDKSEQDYMKATRECDYKNIYRTIERDVVRTFPDMEFFRQADMQDILSNILFTFASENPHLSYKQGMHELLATLLYVAHTDSQNCLINYQGDYANESIATLLDIKHLEHDVYHLFSALMKSIETWYQNDEILMITEPSSKVNVNKKYSDYNNRIRSSSLITNSTPPKQQTSSVLGLKLKKISENIVKKHDLELFNHLEALQIAPQIYGIRWMRLLFGREYEFLDLLTVWDAIICDVNCMSLVDYVFASMLITIREELINGDYTDCLNKLMRHQFKDVPYVIRLALHLRDPVNNVRPNGNRHQYTNSYYQLPSLSRKQPSATKSPTKSKLRQSSTLSSMERQLAATSLQKSKGFEMREMLPMKSGTSSSGQKFPIGLLSRASGSLDVSNESYEDLHSIVDYCWRLLSEQIDSLQRCLPKEKSLHSEDEIFVALAQLKKVRDVLKGSLRLEDELEAVNTAATTASTSVNSNRK